MEGMQLSKSWNIFSLVSLWFKNGTEMRFLSSTDDTDKTSLEMTDISKLHCNRPFVALGPVIHPHNKLTNTRNVVNVVKLTGLTNCSGVESVQMEALR